MFDCNKFPKCLTVSLFYIHMKTCGTPVGRMVGRTWIIYVFGTLDAHLIKLYGSHLQNFLHFHLGNQTRVLFRTVQYCSCLLSKCIKKYSLVAPCRLGEKKGNFGWRGRQFSCDQYSISASIYIATHIGESYTVPVEEVATKGQP